MIVIRSNIIPFKGFCAITLWPFIFFRKDAEMSDVVWNHELIHQVQQTEMLVILFYLWYGVEYLIKLLKFRNFRCAYRNVGFEIEAYVNEEKDYYLEERKHYSWYF